jgi:flavin-dependent dehydrogenase
MPGPGRVECRALALALLATMCAGQTVQESARRIPVVATVDVVVVGGTVAGVAAATEAARAGRTVYLVAPRPHLGEDLADRMRLWLDPGEKPTGELTEKIFSPGTPAPPVRAKKVLEDALLKAQVSFLLSTFATDVLTDGAGRPAGVVIANRAGRQAVVAKVVIDATEDASIARRAGAVVRRVDAGPVEFRRVVLGADGKTYTEHKVSLPLPDLTVRTLAEAEQVVRDRTSQPGQQRASAHAWFARPDAISGLKPASEWHGFDGFDAGHFRPRGYDRIFVAGGCGDIPRDAARELLGPTRAESAGRRIGAAAAREAGRLPGPQGAHLGANATRQAVAGDVKETLSGLRPSERNSATLTAGTRAVPVYGTWDVVVVGGGTSGAAAAIGAARRGAKTLVVEYQDGLGGTGTLGMIGKPYHGREAGFSKEVPFPGKTSTIEDKMEWYRREIRKAGGEIWFEAAGVGALVERGRVSGAVIAARGERGMALAKVVIDATGNADVAVAAGAGWFYGGDAEDIAMQGAGLPKRAPGDFYVNTDFLLVDETDMVDVWTALVGVRQRMDEAAFDSGSLIQTRERRRVEGDHVLSYLDQIAGRKYPDSIVYSGSDYDSHGYPSDDFFALIPHDEKSRKANHPAPGGTCYTPYRSLLPKGLDGILVTGLGISMHRDASAMVRMQRDLANQGYAAGVAAAMAAKTGTAPRAINVRALQKHLVEIGSLPPEVLEHVDSFPRPAEEIRWAVRLLPRAAAREETGRRLGLILSHREVALPMLREAWSAAEAADRLVYARVLGMLGERSVVPELAAALDAVHEWDARILQGVMAEYAHLPTPIDTLILALGRTRDVRALPALLRKLETLDEGVTLSHHRSLALAFESIGDRSAAQPLAQLLARHGMSGHALTKLEPLYDAGMERRRRLGPLREIVLARALYRCGDWQGIGQRILTGYRRDSRGLFARHATAVLEKR